ncbi:MAG: NADH:ubiquinone reductase (Na(+)-transporting) subunit D [Lentisphaeria bacterium]|nr:NADH:ubiquinone reductase (Na(+)-transporting) subunit D [Lentisphaeria bacterium]
MIEPVQKGMGKNNPILRQALGICSALAITNLVSTTIVMSISLLFVASFSCLAISLLRNAIPHRVRLIAEMLIISTLVIVVDLYLQAFHFETSRLLGPYVGLIITNCIILGRCEGFALRNSPVRAFFDGLGNAAGYAVVLLIISLVREPLGSGMITLVNHADGTDLAFRVLPACAKPALLLQASPGAFLTMGVVVWIVRAIWPEEDVNEHPEAGAR